MEKWPRISVVILNYNGLNDTLHCLESLDKCTYPNLDIILLDNGSPNTDEPKVLEKIKQKNYRFIATGKNLGFAGGCNFGMEIALKEGKSEYIYLLNNDTEVEPDVFEKVIEVAEKNPEIGIVASKSFYYGERTLIESAGLTLLNSGEVVARGRGVRGEKLNKDEELLGVCGAAMLLRCSMLREIGLFDDEFFLYSEDSDLSLRAIATGWKCWYAHKSVIYHKVSVATKKVRNYKFNVKARFNQFKAYFCNMPWIIMILNFIPFVVWSLIMIIGSLVFLKWKIALSFFHAIGQFFGNFGKVWRKRRGVMALKKASGKKVSVWHILKLQRSFVPVYLGHFKEIILRGRKSVWE
jgi:GT2 family glycosyltransferase